MLSGHRTGDSVKSPIILILTAIQPAMCYKVFNSDYAVQGLGGRCNVMPICKPPQEYSNISLQDRFQAYSDAALMSGSPEGVSFQVISFISHHNKNKNKFLIYVNICIPACVIVH